MAGKSAPAAPAPVAPPTPIPDPNASSTKAIGSTASTTAFATSEEGKKAAEAEKTGIGIVAPQTRKKDPASTIANAAPGGLASSAVLTG